MKSAHTAIKRAWDNAGTGVPYFLNRAPQDYARPYIVGEPQPSAVEMDNSGNHRMLSLRFGFFHDSDDPEDIEAIYTAFFDTFHRTDVLDLEEWSVIWFYVLSEHGPLKETDLGLWIWADVQIHLAKAA